MPPFLRLIGAALFAAAMLTVTPASAVDITIYHYQVGANYKAFRGILDEFQKENPGIEVKDVYAPSTQITAEVQAALAAGRPVDIATVIGKNVRYFIKNTPAVAINADPGKAAFLDNYLPNFLDIGRIGDKVYAVPHAYGTPLMFYNKDLFRKAGLDPDNPPTDWPTLIGVAETLKAKTGAGLAHFLGSNKDYGTMLMVMNAGGTYLSDDGTCAEFDSPAGISALQMWQDLVVKDKVTPVATDRQFEGAFTSGQLGIFLYSSAALRPFLAASKGKFALGVAGYPSFKSGMKRRLPNSGAALMLYAPEGERRDASLKLLAFLSRREISNRWARESGYMPLAKDPLADPVMADYVAKFPFARPIIDQMSVTVPTSTWGKTGAIEAQTTVSNLIDKLWANDGTAADLVPAAVKHMNDVMGCKAR